jgi:glycerophosphoryl diester phosphodiesterase
VPTRRCSVLVIAHRGASGLRPEHTLAAYALAIEQGADFIEPDLVVTKDGVLVARHENEISGTTDVAEHPEFADRQTAKSIDGVETAGWFTEDFTLAELKTLRARERIPAIRPANAAYDGLFEIPTLEEIIDLAGTGGARRGRPVGIYPETKHPTYFRSIGLGLEEPLAAILRARGLGGPDAPVFLQSFEPSSLQRLATLTDLPLVQLLTTGGQPYDFAVRGDAHTYNEMTTPDGLAEVARYARAIGPNKDLILPRDEAGHVRAQTTLVDDAHAAGLLVHAWTFRNEDQYLPLDFHGRPEAEYERAFRLGVDGVFTDFPATADAVRRVVPDNCGRG